MKSDIHFFVPFKQGKNHLCLLIAMANLSYIICLFSELLHLKPGLNILGQSLLDIELGMFFFVGTWFSHGFQEKRITLS